VSRFLLSCGGTGGHLAPGIALAEGLRARGHETLLAISRKRVDARMAEKYPALRFVPLAGSGLAGGWTGLPAFARDQAVALAQGVALLRRERPGAIVGFGGFTSAGVLAAGALLGIPLVLHEANRVPGRAVRLMARFARRVYLPGGVGLAGAARGAVREAGLPVRREFSRLPAAEARRSLGLAETAPAVAVLGGSQGASALNAWARDAWPRLAAEGFQLYVVTGPGREAEGAGEWRERSRDGTEVRAVFTPFTDRMAAVLSAADLAVTRAGAGTLAELARIGVPAALVPYPLAADNHQEANARAFAGAGGGAVVPQTAIGGLTEAVLALLADPGRRERMREALGRMDRADPVPVMIRDLEALADGQWPAEAGGAAHLTA
jgi:UDP-N-acetylglucosamine--N-acetylmuramyl-(pentapeptide) pyrophosphoryl-undecaprenol N-acetylglucosamine transferase